MLADIDKRNIEKGERVEANVKYSSRYYNNLI